MKFNPMHDASGVLYPELDFRWVSAAVVAVYLGVSMWSVYGRATSGEFGKIQLDGANGVRKYTPPRSKKPRLEFRPGIVWMQRRLGRYADARFDWRQLERCVAVRTCPMVATTNAELVPVAATPPDPVRDFGVALVRMIQQSLPQGTQEVLEFPGLRVRDSQ